MTRIFLLLCVSFSLSGCFTPPVRDDVGRLLKHPQLDAAFKAAPDFTEEALTTIARLNHELNSPRP
jgi:pantoate kinase